MQPGYDAAIQLYSSWAGPAECVERFTQLTTSAERQRFHRGFVAVRTR
jgi:hypothetical protein